MSSIFETNAFANAWKNVRSLHVAPALTPVKKSADAPTAVVRAVRPLKSAKSLKPVLIAIEYHSPHWVVLVRNPGQSFWEFLRSRTRFIDVLDRYGVITKRKAAIEVFDSYSDAHTHAQTHLSQAELTTRGVGFWASLLGVTKIEQDS